MSPILQDINLTFAPGTVTVIMGPSGSGKSTLARVIIGIWPQVEGEVLLDDKPIRDWSRDDIGPFIGYGRLLAVVWVPDGPLAPTDLSLWLLEQGLAWHYRAHADEQPLPERWQYALAEAQARWGRRGLWQHADAVPPWQWRRQRRIPSAHADGALAVTVIAVHDGDTLRVLDGTGRERTVRLAVIDAPEIAQPFGEQARDAVRALAQGRLVRLEPRGHDRYGRQGQHGTPSGGAPSYNAPSRLHLDDCSDDRPRIPGPRRSRAEGGGVEL